MSPQTDHFRGFISQDLSVLNKRNFIYKARMSRTLCGKNFIVLSYTESEIPGVQTWLETFPVNSARCAHFSLLVQ